MTTSYWLKAIMAKKTGVEKCAESLGDDLCSNDIVLKGRRVLRSFINIKTLIVHHKTGVACHNDQRCQFKQNRPKKLSALVKFIY
jgi:hypothetical protein